MEQGYLIDLDGTIYVGKDRLPEAEAFIKRLQKKNIPFLFVTNNATKLASEVREFLAQHCQLDVLESQIYTSGQAAVDYITREKIGKKGMIIGEPALHQLAEQANLTIDEQNPDFVLQALDRSVTYEQLKTASLAILQGAQYILTNGDSNLPTEEGLLPGAGALSAFIQAATHVKPVLIGKPSKIIVTGALAKLGLPASQVAMIGDNYNTDIMAGIHNGLATILVLTGFTRPEVVAQLPIEPTHVVAHLGEWDV